MLMLSESVQVGQEKGDLRPTLLDCWEEAEFCWKQGSQGSGEQRPSDEKAIQRYEKVSLSSKQSSDK